MTKLTQSGERVLIAANVITVLILLGLCVCFFGETTEGTALVYFPGLEFPEATAVSLTTQKIFGFAAIIGDLVGGLSNCRIQAVKKPPIRTGFLSAIPFMAVLLIMIAVFWNRMILNLIIPMLLCLESLFFLWLCTQKQTATADSQT